MTDYRDTCGCNQPLHYSEPWLEAFVKSLIKEKGPMMIMITVPGTGHVMVPRHYIALHGPTSGADFFTLAKQFGWPQGHTANSHTS